MQPPDTISRFLWSIGKREDSDFYLNLFRAEAKERFAAIAVDNPVVTHALPALLGDVRFLADLGLIPILVLGLIDAHEAAAHAATLVEELARVGVPARAIPEGLEGGCGSVVRACAREGTIPVVAHRSHSGEPVAHRFDRLAALVSELSTRKVVFLQRRGGLMIDGQRLGIVELGGDQATLMASPEVSKKQKMILTGIAGLLDRLTHRCTFALTSPLELLRELFTASGSGTFVRRAAKIESHGDFNSLDRDRLRALFESAFERPLAPDFFDRQVSRIYLEENYRGAAIVNETELGTYMSKFAVDREAQGEGIGRDVWNALIADHARVFWRSRAANPVNNWYARECDGLLRGPTWQFFWRGIPVEKIPEAVAFAMGQPKDFPPKLGA